MTGVKVLFLKKATKSGWERQKIKNFVFRYTDFEVTGRYTEDRSLTSYRTGKDLRK